MPIYRETLKAEVRVLILSSKPLRDDQRGAVMVELEQIANANGGSVHQLVKIDNGAHIKANLRLHLKELK